MLEAQPLVSVIIPTFNRAQLIIETLESINKQTYANWECIIVDDGSNDNSEFVISNYAKSNSRFYYYKRPNNMPKGANACRNYGLLKSKGQYVNWFDDDDIMHPEKLEIQLNAIHNTSYNFTVCQTYVFQNSIENLKGLRHQSINSNNALKDFILQNNVFLTQAPFFKRSFLVAYNLGFDMSLQAAQEWEFLTRVIYFSKTYHSIATTKPLVYFRKHQNSISHGMSYKERKWHYFVARCKIRKFLANHKPYKNEKAISLYLDNYIKDYFRNLIFSNNTTLIFNTFKKEIKPMYTWLKGIQIYLYMLLVRLTGKGFNYRKKIIN